MFFNNRNGGHIILGVVDQTKEIRGVNPQKTDKMLKDFTTSVNNANKINPPLYLTPQIFDINGKTVIYIWVPEGTQLRRLNGRIWDRTHEGILILQTMRNWYTKCMQGSRALIL